MARGFIIFLLLLSSLGLNAQKVVVSGKSKLNKNYSKFKVLGKMNDQYLVERVGKHGNIIDLYDYNLNLRFSKNINLAKRQTHIRTWVQPSASWVLIREDDKSFSILKASKIDKKLNVSDNLMVLDTLYERSDLIANNLRVDFSMNESHMAVFLPVFSAGKINHFQFNIYDTNMKLVQKKKISDEWLNLYKFHAVNVLNDGSFVLILEQERTAETPNNYFFFYGKPGEPVSKFTYQSHEPVFRKIKFEVDNFRNDLMVAGMYEYRFDKRKEGGAYKFFTARINLETGKEYLHSANRFSNDFYKDITGKNSTDEIILFYTFYVNRIIGKADGGMIVLNESYYKNEEERIVAPNPMFYGPTFGSFVPVITHNFNDIIVFDFDSLTQINRVQIVRKRQISENDNGSYSSFFTMNERDRLRLFFLEDISRQSNFSEFAFTDTEAGKKRSLFNSSEKDVFPITKMSVQTGVNEVIIPSFVNNQFSLIKIHFP